MLLPAVILVLMSPALAEPATGSVASAVASADDVQRFALQLRDARAPLERRVAAVRGLAAAGDAGAGAWRDHLDREVARLAAVADARPRDTAVDREIDSLRGTLAELRADPDLTERKLEQRGLPAPGHHKNLLASGHRRQGLGRSGRHWTQLFGE